MYVCGMYVCDMYVCGIRANIFIHVFDAAKIFKDVVGPNCEQKRWLTDKKNFAQLGNSIIL